MKCLALLLVIVQAGSPVPRHTPQNPANNRTRNTQSNQKDQTQAPAPPSIQSKEHTGTAKGDGNNETPKHEQEHVIVEKLPDKDLWERAYIIFTGALALIGLFTLGVVTYQAVQTKRATVAMAASTDLQKAALRQWVNIQGFRDAVEPRFTDAGPQLDLQLSFEITNPTKMPLTLEWYVISINTAKYSSRLSVTLAPDQVHGLKALISYTDEVRDKYIRDGYVITITGVIAYTDALREFQKQRFGYLRRCRAAGGGETLNYQGSLPDDDIEKEESKT
jgi:hypothetical protein